MTLAAKAAAVFGYRILPTSIIALLTYLALFVALIVTDILPSVPSINKQGGLDLSEAYKDLRHITSHPHPYNSHANDHARIYILDRLKAIQANYSHVDIFDDMSSNGSWAGAYGVYFEGTNILVKVDGTSPPRYSRGGILFSAHYDSVSTAPGATDDGMGVVSLIQLVEYFSENRMPRTAVFNINNGEEDWLNGAHAFLEHPWSNLTDTFLNLEGAAAGGRPILFRASSTPSVRSFRNTKLVPHPHANVFSSDAFARGFIRSGTDFSVYTNRGPRSGMDGLDLAFYKGRSRYHTKYDAAQYTLGGEKSLWSMMETARGVGVGLLSAPYDERREVDADLDVEDGDSPVYFDLFKSLLIVFPISKLFTFNVFTLVIGPIILILLVLCEFLLVKSREKAAAREEHHHNAARVQTPPLLHHTTSSPSTGPEHPHHGFHLPGHHDDHDEEPANEEPRPADKPRGAAARWAHVIWRHAKFWVALVIVIGVQTLLAWSYVVINPFAVYASPYIVLASFVTLAYLALTFTLTFPSSLPFYHPKLQYLFFTEAVPPPAQQQKHTIFIHLYIFTWVFLVLSTLGITKLHPGVGSGYIISAWNLCVGAACLFAAIEGLILTSIWSKPSTAHGAETEAEEPYEELEGEESGGRNRAHTPRHMPHLPHPHHEDADERTPLIYHERTADGGVMPTRPKQKLTGEEEEGGGVGTLATWWWIPQFLVSVPIPVTLLAHVTMLVLDAMPQTLSDGPSPWIVYALTAFPALLLVLPLAPFAYKLRPFKPLTLLMLLIFVLSTGASWLSFPFSVEAPLKIYFQQSVIFPPRVVLPPGPSDLVLNANANASEPPQLITVLIGPQRYLRRRLLPYLPSSQEGGPEVQCTSDPLKFGLTRCQWESGTKMLPVPGSVNLTHEDTFNSDGDAETKWEKGEFFKAHVNRTGPSTARIRVRGKNTRNCRVYFDSAPIHRYDVLDFSGNTDTLGSANATGKEMQRGYEVPKDGVKEVRLWSRTWEKEFVVDVDWGTTIRNPDAYGDEGKENTQMSGMQGRVACEWNEYESALVDNGPLNKENENRLVTTSAAVAGRRAKIPALEEVLAFLPEWAVVSKAADGLVEAWVPFVL